MDSHQGCKARGNKQLSRIRQYHPSGEFPDAFQITVINTADDAEAITFDSAGLNQAIAQDERGIFVFDGTTWLKVYVGS
jgi:hypothetical protein